MNIETKRKLVEIFNIEHSSEYNIDLELKESGAQVILCKSFTIILLSRKSEDASILDWAQNTRESIIAALNTAKQA